MKDLYKTLILGFIVISAISIIIFLAVRTEPFITDCQLPFDKKIEEVPKFEELINTETININSLQQETDKVLNDEPIDYEKEDYLKNKAEVIRENDSYLENSLEGKPDILEKTLKMDQDATNLENSYKKIATRSTNREEFTQQEFINVYDTNFGGILPTTLGL